MNTEALPAGAAGALTSARPWAEGVYPSGLERDVRTGSGRVVHLRPIRPDDGALLVDFHSGLSPHSVYLRYFAFHPALSEREVERFTHVDYVKRLALILVCAGRIVAVGRYDRLQETDDAEVAFVVADSYQGDGLGTLLADELAGAAFERGIRRFVAETLPENGGMIEVLRGLGFPVTNRFSDGLVRVAFPIDPVPGFAKARAQREASRLLVDPAAQEAHHAGRP